MKLTDLNPRFVSSGGEGITDGQGNPVPERQGVGLGFDCPCAKCTAQRTGDFDRDFHLRVFVDFTNPLDGGPANNDRRPTWHRTGETFDTLVLQPSILSDAAKGGCGWHGYVGGPNGDQPGMVVTL